jgi:hypothetical protein
MSEAMSHVLLENLQELYEAGQYQHIVRRLRWFSIYELPADIDFSIVVDVILRTFRPYADEDEIWETAALIWQLERQGLLDQNDLNKIANIIGESFQNTKRKIPFCLSSTELIHELQQLHEEGQYLQILRRLRQYKIDKLPAGIDVSIAVEAIIRTFRSSSDEDDISRATGLKWQLENQNLLNPNDSNRIFNVVVEAFLNAKGELPSFLIHALVSPHDKVVPENLLRIYDQAKTREARFVLAEWIGAFYKERGLLVLIDNLFAQQIIGNDSIRAILAKYSLLAGVSLESDECDAIVSAALDYLETPGPRIENWDDDKKYKIDSINRTSAARILVALNRYSKTSKESQARIQGKGDVIVTYFCFDLMYDVFEEIRLSRYLSGGIN